jgi:hypothetical protein
MPGGGKNFTSLHFTSLATVKKSADVAVAASMLTAADVSNPRAAPRHDDEEAGPVYGDGSGGAMHAVFRSLIICTITAQ